MRVPRSAYHSVCVFSEVGILQDNNNNPTAVDDDQCGRRFQDKCGRHTCSRMMTATTLIPLEPATLHEAPSALAAAAANFSSFNRP